VMARVKTAMENNDSDTAVREAHTVKGLAGNIGATPMAECAGLVEGMLKRGETEGLAAALDAMEAELGSLLARISAALGEVAPAAPSNSPSPASINREVLAADLRKLGALLADGDSEASGVAENLAERLSALGQGQATKAMLKQVAEFEYDTARERLADIARLLDVAL